MSSRRPDPQARTAPSRDSRSAARDRVLEAAYELFSRHGIRAVGVDAVIARSGVAKMTLYRHFASKDALVLEFLREREARWTVEWLQGEVEARASDPAERLLAVFDVFDPWFRRDDFEGCAFINVLLETPDTASAIHRASVAHLATIRAYLAAQAAAAGAADPDALARELHILMKGSIVAAGEGDRAAARRAQGMARLVLREHGLLG
jgi:AcrR family transcriptional regulator